MREINENRVLAAAEGIGIAMHFQPIVDLETGEVAYHEALLRLDTPEGYLTPDIILPIAQELGIMVKLDAQVIREAAKWSQKVGPCSVNVASVAASTADLCRYRDYDIKVEISEQDPSLKRGVLATKVAALNEIGMEVLLDDFGDGEMRCVHILEGVAGIKLDRRLTNMIIAGGAVADAVALMLIHLRKSGLQIVAEGIETRGGLKALKGIASHGQGWLFGRPELPKP